MMNVRTGMRPVMMLIKLMIIIMMVITKIAITIKMVMIINGIVKIAVSSAPQLLSLWEHKQSM